ncbi:hemolysin family protein [Pseudoalteromonas xiamenensis]|uniref:Polyamine export protein n=1 Tax=Pseudoalteromonas xiamenensis TaxID=882626 RepID=A0A975DH61_9GAMM|nr:hemolysin family protein [Pseudoalteromonas xiamenensis]QTH71120.1 HlyC/CorC family transporter [Pseudoalteromonas xiamenensis]
MSDLLAIAALIMLSALFAMSEIAIAASRKIKLKVLKDEGVPGAHAVLALQENPGAFFAMVQIALNAIAILGGILGEQALTDKITHAITERYDGPWAEEVGFVISFFIITSTFILFADLLPKRIAMIVPEAVALKVVHLMNMITFAFSPLVACFNGLTNFFIRLLGLPAERQDSVTAEEIVAMVDAGAESGSLQAQEYQLIGNVFELEGRTLPTIMTTREVIVYFDINDDSETITTKIMENPHNHFLVCDGGLDKLVGYVESKQILKQLLSGNKVQLNQTILEKELFYLPDTLTLTEALNAFRKAAIQFAVVINEYALVVGIITVKDIMTSFMGDLAPHTWEEQIVARDANSWLVDGSTPIVDLCRTLGWEDAPDPGNYETVAGFLIFRLKRIPKRTDFIICNGFKFEAIDMEGMRVEQLLVTRTDLDDLNGNIP